MTSARLSSTRSRKIVTRLKRRIAAAAVLLAVFGMWYLFATNAVVAEGYHLADAYEAREAARRRLENARVSLEQAVIPDKLEARAHASGFVPLTNPRYLVVPGSTVASR